MSNVKERVEEFWIANSCNARVAADYNKFMGAVDQHGALRGSASCSQMSMKWWHTLFWWMLDAAMVNAYCVYAFAEKKAGARSVMHFQQVRDICSTSLCRAHRRDEICSFNISAFAFTFLLRVTRTTV